MMKINFKDTWIKQESNNPEKTIKNEIIINNTKCYIGRISTSNAKMFQIEVSNVMPIHKNYLRRFHGVEIRVIEYDTNKKHITIILSDNDLLEIFVLFLNDLSDAIETMTTENEIPAIIYTKVNYWARLFARISGDFLSKEKQRGLYGELFFLQNLLNKSPDHEKCIMTWTGPEGTNQDFSNQVRATEIKTSKATKPTVNIASELQLDWKAFENLFLVIIHIDEISNGIYTLKKLIVEIKNILGNQLHLTELFEAKLSTIGIQIGDEENYCDTGYLIRSIKAYQVTEGFPVLTNEIIKNEAIHNIQYQIDITACKPFELSFEQVLNKML